MTNNQQNNSHRLFQIIQRPVISEKATYVAEKNNQYIFKVAKDSNKLEIKQALESVFEVEVISVNVVNRKGKQKRFGKYNGRRDNQRFAYVSLKEGQNIDIEAEIK